MQCELEVYSQLKKIIFIFFCIFGPAFAGPSFNVDRQGRVLKSYSINESCIKHFKESPLLSNVEGSSKINCMGKTFNPRFLCQGEKVVNSLFTRALISDDKKEVICEFSSFVKLNLICSNPLIKDECMKSARQACQKLGASYAHDLKLAHFAKIKDDEHFLVDCHFSNQLIQ